MGTNVGKWDSNGTIVGYNQLLTIIGIHVGKTMPQTTHDWKWMGMVYTTYRHGDDCGMVHGMVLPTLFQTTKQKM